MTTVTKLGTLVIFLLAQSAFSADVKIGIVDMQKALRTVEAGKKAKQDLETAFNKKKEELEKEQEALKKMDEELKKQSLALSDKAKEKKQLEFQKRLAEFQQKTAQSQMEIQQKEQNLTGPIIEKLRKLISDIAKDKKYTVVLEKNENNVLFSQDQDEFTDEVVSKFNSAKN